MEWIRKHQKLLLAGLWLLIAFISFQMIANSQMIMNINHRAVIDLDEKKETVMALIFASGGASMSLEAIIGDVGKSIAENIADLTMYLAIVLGGIWLQKYLLSVTGILAFKILIPIAFVLLASNIFLGREEIRNLVKKLLLFAVLIFGLIPSSVWVSNHIESYYTVSTNISIDKLVNDSNFIEQSTEQLTQQETEVVEENKNLWDQISGVVGSATEQVSTFVGDVINVAGEIKEKAETFLGNMIEAVVVLIITTCVMPILVCFLFLWGINLIFGLNLKIKYSPKDVRNLRKEIVKWWEESTEGTDLMDEG
ncbi:hypothetical protein NHG23_04995 [Aerococcaceae bacterium NML190073]|nr:hypothetical protein [Aerococcaceae bacterium NML190073]